MRDQLSTSVHLIDASRGRGAVYLIAEGRTVLHVEFVDGAAIGWDPQAPDRRLLERAARAFADVLRASRPDGGP
jgi:hypothetical protein